MSTQNNNAALVEMASKVVFSSYCSDGPGYSGPLAFEIAGDKITVTAGYVHTWTLPDRLSQVIGVRDYQDEDLSFVESNLCAEDLDYLRGSDGSLCLDDDRVKILDFADGQVGFFIVHGEPCFFCLVCGSHRYSVSEECVDTYHQVG